MSYVLKYFDVELVVVWLSEVVWVKLEVGRLVLCKFRVVVADGLKTKKKSSTLKSVLTLLCYKNKIYSYVNNVRQVQEIMPHVIFVYMLILFELTFYVPKFRLRQISKSWNHVSLLYWKHILNWTPYKLKRLIEEKS